MTLGQKRFEANNGVGVLRDDVIVQAAIVRPIMKCEINLHSSAFACSELNLLSGYCEMTSRTPTMAFYDAQSSLRGFPRHYLNASLIRKVGKKGEMRRSDW